MLADVIFLQIWQRNRARFDCDAVVAFMNEQAEQDFPAPLQGMWAKLLRSPVLRTHVSATEFLTRGIPLSESELYDHPKLAVENSTLVYQLTEGDSHDLALLKRGQTELTIVRYSSENGVAPNHGRGKVKLADLVAHELLIWKSLGASLPAGAQARDRIRNTVAVCLNDLQAEAKRALANAVAFLPEQGRIFSPRAVVIFEEAGARHGYRVLAADLFRDPSEKIALECGDAHLCEDSARKVTLRFDELFDKPDARGLIKTSEAGDFHVLANWHACSPMSQRNPNRPSLMRTLDDEYVLFCPRAMCSNTSLVKAGAVSFQPRQ